MSTRYTSKRGAVIVIKLGDLRIVASPPDFELTPEQVSEIETWVASHIEAGDKKKKKKK